jgi:TPR repeat protein
MKPGNIERSLLLVLLFIATAYFPTIAQTKYYEDIVIQHYFERFISNINNHLSPTLTAAERKKLERVVVTIDSTQANIRTIKSDSKRKTITIGVGLIRDLVKFSVAKLIDFDTASFDRNRFSGFYLSLYPYLSENTYPEDAAELTTEQRNYLRRIGDTDEFSWTISGKIMFIYLHEVAHQFQDYSSQVDKIMKKKVSVRDSLLQNLELDADQFAVIKIAQMKLIPLEYAEVMAYFSIVKEERFSTVQQLAFRQVNYFNTCHQLYGCDQHNNEECRFINKRIDEFALLYNYYRNLYSTESLKEIHKKAIDEKNVHALYNLGDFYLKSTSLHESNLDSALILYEKIVELNATENQLYGANSIRQFNDIYEYASVVAGKIYEHKKRDPLRAISFYEKAAKNPRFLTKDYYTKLIDRLRKS